MQRQAELGKPRVEFLQTRRRLAAALETDHKIIRIAHDHHIAATPVERGTVVRSVRVDDLCAEHAPGVEVSAIKIDVQGAEAQVLAGTTETLERHPHVEVLIEFWPQGLRRFGTDPTDLVRRWRDLGFESLLLDARGHRVPVDGRFFEVARSWPRRHADLLLTRRPTRWTKFR